MESNEQNKHVSYKKPKAIFWVNVLRELEKIKETGLLPLPTSRVKIKAIDIYKAKTLDNE